MPSDNRTFIHGVALPREAQDVLIESWLKDVLCRLNPDIGKDPERADEIIYKLCGVLLEASHSGLVRANELFTEWLHGEKSMPPGKDGEPITINLIDYHDHFKNHYVVSQQVPSMGAKNAFFDFVLYVNGIPLVVGEVKTPVREVFFQAVSNFSWDNFGYWAASGIEGADTLKELRMLSSLHGALALFDWTLRTPPPRAKS